MLIDRVSECARRINSPRWEAPAGTKIIYWPLNKIQIRMDSESKDEITLEQRVEQLELKTKQLQETVDRLQERLQFLEDLNLVNLYITKYYTEVFRVARSLFLVRSGRQLCSWSFKTWVDLFMAIGWEDDEFRTGKRKDKPLNALVQETMHRLGGLSSKDWTALQNIRHERNVHGHPDMDDAKAEEAVERWSDDDAKSALTKMMRFVCKQTKSNSFFSSRKST